VIPKTLAVNAGFDAQEAIVKLIEARVETIEQQAVGLDLNSGEPFCPLVIAIYPCHFMCLYTKTF